MENRINDVYEVFKDYYGEDRVDLQDLDIIVHFPRVTVTNENNESVEVTDLYVKTKILSNGTMNGVFTMTRGSYPLSHVYSDYLHSHVFTIPHNDYEFSRCCTGTGPIVRTMSLLARECDLDRWALYCYELDKYTQVESEAGVPYHHLNRISVSGFKTEKLSLGYYEIPTYRFNLSVVEKETLKGFLPYLINKKVLNFSVANDHYLIAHSFLDYISIITTAFVEYINSSEMEHNIEYYITEGLLVKGTYENGVFKTRTPNRISNYTNPEGRIACRFKGEEIRITVTNDIVNLDDSKDLIVCPAIANFILYKILATLNYGNITRTQAPSTEEGRTIII